MHDLDRTQLEAKIGELEEEELESPEDAELFEMESEFEMESDSPFDESEEMELAAELMEVSNDAELEQFLGSLFKKVARKVRKAVKSPVGRLLRRTLRRAARKALPIAGGAVGTWFGGPAGGAIGGRLARSAGRIFGLELEGMSPEDQEFEVARRVVRLCGSAVANAADAQEVMSPTAAVKKAVVTAARQHAPGLVRGATARSMVGGMRSGRWIRRGRRIVLHGV